jgi:MFS family permease
MSEPIPRRPGPHYGWVVAATGTLCIFAALGLGRFALGMLLPSMAGSLGLSHVQSGSIGTANFVGYLAAVLLCGHVAARTGARVLVFVALVTVAVTMLLVARASSFAAILVLYAVTGAGSGAANVPIMGLVAAWFHGSVRARAAGFVVIGSGFAIIASGQLIPYVNRAVGPEGWRTSWTILGATVGAIAVLALLLLRNRPAAAATAPAHAAPAARAAAPAPRSFYRTRAVWILAAAYALFGFTYAIYVTFIVMSLIRERGFPEQVAGTFWSWVGFLSLFSGPVFGAVSDRLGRRTGLQIVFALQMLAYALAGARLPDPFLYASIACFGIVAWSIPSIMLAAVSEHVDRDRTLAAFGFITFVFGLGQISGPLVAGTLAEWTGSFSSSFFLAAALAAGAILLTWFLPHPAAEDDRRGPAPAPAAMAARE